MGTAAAYTFKKYFSAGILCRSDCFDIMTIRKPVMTRQSAVSKKRWNAMKNNVTKTQKKKKGQLGQIVMMLVFMLLGGVCGLMIGEYFAVMDTSFFVTLALMILMVYGAMLVQIILHEGGHLVGGLLSGYRFCSFRIFGLILVREKDGLHLRRYSLAGTAGQCLMAPPDLVNGRLPVTLYNLGGPLANFITAAVFFALSLAVSAPFAVLCLRMLALVGVVFGLSNGLPMSVGPVDNDGKNALSLQKDPQALQAFWVQMKIAQYTADGCRMKDMPAEWFTLPPNADLNNPLVAAVAVFAGSRLLDEGNFQQADEAMARLLAGNNGVLELYRCQMRRERAFLELIGQNRPDQLAALYTAADTKMLKSMKNNPTVLRVDYAHALLAEKDAKKAARIKTAFEKAVAHHPYAGEVQSERELLALADAAAERSVAVQQA